MQKYLALAGLAMAMFMADPALSDTTKIDWVYFDNKDLKQLDEAKEFYLEEAIGREALDELLTMVDTHEIEIKIEQRPEYTFYSTTSGKTDDGRLCEITVKETSKGSGKLSGSGVILSGSGSGGGSSVRDITIKLRCRDVLRALQIIKDEQ